MSAPTVAAGRPATPGFSQLMARIGLLPVLIVIMILLMSIAEPRFYGSGNVVNIVRTTALLAVVASGQALVLIIGGFDLSVGAIIALASVITAKAMGIAAALMPGEVVAISMIGIVAGLACGGLVGLVNGLCVAVLKVPGFIVTLGTMSATMGLALMLTSGIPVYGMPAEFVKSFGRGLWFGIPVTVYVALAIVALMIFVQRRTLLGRYLYAIGGNTHAAVVSGISTRPYVIVTYVISGVLAAVTSLLLTAQIGSGQASLGGDRMMLQTIAAAVIGGVSLRGGVGRLERVLISALFLTILTNSLNLLRVDSKIQLIILGLIMVAAVAIDEVSLRRRNRG